MNEMAGNIGNGLWISALGEDITITFEWLRNTSNTTITYSQCNNKITKETYEKLQQTP